MNMLIVENELVRSIPKNIKKTRNGNLRMECVLQTVGDINRNRRRYSRELMVEGLDKIDERLKEGSFLGELDHPIDRNPIRQVSVLYKEASHRILECYWDKNKLVGIVENLRTPNGIILRNLAEDGVPVGFSFRGMGDLRPMSEDGRSFNEVIGPIHVVTWDAVSYPSHAQAKMIRITESVQEELYNTSRKMKRISSTLHESAGIVECNGMICTLEGVCYLPNDFDKLVESKVITLMKPFL